MILLNFKCVMTLLIFRYEIILLSQEDSNYYEHSLLYFISFSDNPVLFYLQVMEQMGVTAWLLVTLFFLYRSLVLIIPHQP